MTRQQLTERTLIPIGLVSGVAMLVCSLAFWIGSVSASTDVRLTKVEDRQDRQGQAFKDMVTELKELNKNVIKIQAVMEAREKR